MKQKYRFYQKEKNDLLRKEIVCHKNYDFSPRFFMPCIMLPFDSIDARLFCYGRSDE